MSEFKVLKQKYNGKDKGSYYVRKLKNGWSVYYSSFDQGKRTDSKIELLAYRELGFDQKWSLAQAKNRCTILNKEKTLIQSRAREAAKTLITLESIDGLLFPDELVQAFNKKIYNENQGSDAHFLKVVSHFNRLQKLAKSLKLLPHDYKENEKLIYKYFESNRMSLDYSKKIISLMNRWGHFYAKQLNRFFEPVAPMRGIARERIADAHENKAGVRTESHPLSPELLESKKSKLNEANYNFLFITVWFGLRPSEAISFKDFKIQTNDEGTKFLVVYQSKLKGLAKDKRYKAIPVLFKEQEIALKIIEAGDIKAPIYKIMRSVFGESYGLYAGRKGFTDLMLNKGYSLEDVSLWLGHASIETTWKRYKNKNPLNLKTPQRNKNQ